MNDTHRAPSASATPDTMHLQNATHYAAGTFQDASSQQRRHDARPLSSVTPDDSTLYDSNLKRKVTSTSIRRRTSRACDQCNQARTKCNGKAPCQHCLDAGLSCAYARAQKKRGKAPRKSQDRERKDKIDLLANLSAHRSSNSQPINPISADESAQLHSDTQMMPNATNQVAAETSAGHDGVNGMSEASQTGPIVPHSGPTSEPLIYNPPIQQSSGLMLPDENDFMQDDFQMMDHHAFNAFGMMDQQQQQQGDLDSMYPMRRLHQAVYIMDPTQDFQQHQLSEAADWTTGIENGQELVHNRTSTVLTSASPGAMSHESSIASASAEVQRTIRYPVLQPLVTYLKSVKISQSLASNLLEHYFASSFRSNPHPASPYLLGFAFNRRSFLTPTKPRECRPALLASMLWLSAHTCDVPLLASSQAARSRICQKLLDLSLYLLNPLIHQRPSSGSSALKQASKQHDFASSDLREFDRSVDRDSPGRMAEGSVDDIATYMHLATIVSAGEAKGASLRWWTAAWNLAKELRLGQELPTTHTATSKPSAGDDEDEDTDEEETSNHYTSESTKITEQEREERRRIWWILYINDRHLSLCYNRPIFLKDKDCQGLMRPMDEKVWQTGNFNTTNESGLGNLESQALASHERRRSIFHFTGPSTFGYCLPLMAMLGEIVDLVQARAHPYFGPYCQDAGLFEAQVRLISQQLDEYMRSLEAHRSQHLGSYTGLHHRNGSDFRGQPGHNGQRLNESQIELIIASAYSTHIMHVLHVLLLGRWDPIDLLDDYDWVSSPDFMNAVNHAVSGAEAVLEILEYDPELNFMPYLYGIYLLQGSFLLLLVADRLQNNASSNIVQACTTIVRAHEACVVTLNTEYQRNFRKIMQSALAQVHGRLPEESIEEQRRRRREILALYRWSGSGGGLAL